MPRNPINDGKQMLCDMCRSYIGLQVKCPHNPNNGIYKAENVKCHTDGEPEPEYSDGRHYGALDDPELVVFSTQRWNRISNNMLFWIR